VWAGFLLGLAATRADAAEPPIKLAVCGASSGTAYYSIDGAAGKWTQDGQRGGQLTFVLGKDGEPNVLYRFSDDGTIDTREDGGIVYLVRRDVRTGEFGMVVIYPKSGTAETYNVLRLADGKRQVMWTQNKAHFGPGRRLSSAKVFTAGCD
jgi:hypothetical protein